MKNFLIKLLKILLVFVLSTMIIYTFFTLKKLINLSNKYQISIFGHMTYIYELDTEMINNLSEEVKQMNQFAELLREEAENSIYKNDGLEHSLGDGHIHTFGEFFDPVGFSAWSLLQSTVYNIFAEYIRISIALGIVVAVTYGIISSKKVNKVLKFIIGYIGVMLAFPPLYMYSWTGRFWDFKAMYLNGDSKFFYFAYTIIFLLICLTNYIISKKMTKELNNAIKENKKKMC
ncbi:MAG: hypothetical protein IJW20_01795 [Clostridia bacterium]|nr:hypothetical protein [Clostridia bacterium]